MEKKLNNVPNITPINPGEYKYPTEIIDLPSKGLLYPDGHPLRSGKIEIKYMTAKEEDILSTQSYIKNGVVLDKLFESLIVTKVNYSDLLVGDKNAVMIASRIYGYGPEYTTTVISPSTSKEIPITVNLLTVGHKSFDEGLITPGENRFTFTTPRSHNKIEFRCLTIKDQKAIETSSAEIKKKLGVNRVDTTLTSTLKSMIISVDGNTETAYISNYVSNMLAVDSRAFREYIGKIQPDIDLEVEAEDPDTGETFRSNFTIGMDFFWPDYKG